MIRRSFITKAAAAVAAVVVGPAVASAAEFAGEHSGKSPAGKNEGGDFMIVSDEVKGKVRYVVATPSSIVCSSRINLEIDTATKTIKDCKFTQGCPGNALGLCSLIRGMKVEDVITRLKGTPCGQRATSCPDQLARILAALK